MRPNASGITSANTSHTIGSSNVRRIFATRSSVDSITCDIIRRRSKIYSLPFFDFNVELLMRAYIATLATFALPAGTSGQRDFSAGGYFFLDQDDRTVIPTRTRAIWLIKEKRT